MSGAAPRRLWRGGGQVMLGNAASAGLGLVLLFVLARALPPEGLALVLAVLAVIDGGQMFLDATVNTGMINVAAREGRGGVPDAAVLKAGFLLKLGFGAAYALAVAALAHPLSVAMTGDGALAGPILLAGPAAAVAGLYGFTQARLTAAEAFATLSVLSLSKNLLRLGLVGAVLLVAGPDPRLAAMALGLAAVASCALGVWLTDWSFLRAAAPVAAPMRRLMAVNGWLMVAALAMLAGRYDVWLVGWLSDAAEAGRFALAAQLCVGMGIFTQTLVTTLLPTVSRFGAAGEVAGFLRAAARAAGPLLLVPLLAWPLAHPVLGLVFGPDYAAAAGVFAVLFLGSVMTLVGAPLMLMLLSIGAARIIALAAGLQMALKLAAAAALVPAMGGVGMGLADIFGRLVAMALITGVILAALRRARGSIGGAAGGLPCGSAGGIADA
ncbi:oligosaccharide flippase family protein [Frigidibacter sp. MR17.14]|uniref:lipopolysaccharide biosynthesis protein n=1 Tax=Frigidibacter sp. MR17.14 TaxID=3126509 RepID=UPI003012E691